MTLEVSYRIDRLELWILKVSLLIINRGNLDTPINNVFVEANLVKVGIRTYNLTLCEDIGFDLKG